MLAQTLVDLALANPEQPGAEARPAVEAPDARERGHEGFLRHVLSVGACTVKSPVHERVARVYMLAIKGIDGRRLQTNQRAVGRVPFVPMLGPPIRGQLRLHSKDWCRAGALSFEKMGAAVQAIDSVVF